MLSYRYLLAVHERCQTKVFHVLESRDANCMLRKQHSQHDEVVQKYGAWRMLSCNAAVLVVFVLSNDYYRGKRWCKQACI